MLVKDLVEILSKYDPQDEVLVSLGRGDVRTCLGLREATIHSDVATIKNRQDAVVFGGVTRTAAVVLA